LETFPYKIYSASAGSGKTYILAKEYLKIILSSNAAKSYGQILAITFTNKAVNEMKQRILDNLYDFSVTKEGDKQSDLFLDVSKELQFTPQELQRKAKTIHKSILHNYAFFDISTIDKFTHRLIRTFAKDLKIPQNFEVVLDTEGLLAEAVERLINRAGTDQQLTATLLDFTFEKIDDDKSWDISIDLNKVGKMLFNENNIAHLKNFKNKSISDFLELRKTIQKNIKVTERNAQSTATRILDTIETNGLEFGNFKASYFPKFILKVLHGEFSTDYTAGWKQNFDTDVLYAKSCKTEIKSILDGLHPQFSADFNLIKKNSFERAFYKNIYSNIVPLTVLNEIQKEIQAICIERDQLTLASFNTIISNEIKNQPAPFIYERLGEKYRHYFVDEFQDTSELQWENLVPLIGNALESLDEYGKMGSLLLVGDAKQAIYRWRGGKAEQFIDLSNKITLPYVIEPVTAELPKNYRSYSQIINFNNDFFKVSSDLLHNQVYEQLYVSGNNQEVNTKEGGFVEMSFIPNEKEDNDLYSIKVLETIQDLVEEKKFNFRDICILVRSNSHSYVLADFLTKQEIPIISSESLLLKSSDKVNFLINLLKYSTQPNDLDTAYEVLYFLAREEERKHHFIQIHLKSLARLLQANYGFAIDKLKQSSVYDGLERAIHQFKLAESSDAYITSLMDEVLDVEQKEGVGVQTFLSFWERKKDKLSLKAPDNINAVQIMTVHKSKGLEFPIVIFPFANSLIYNNDQKIWLPVAPEKFNGFSEMLVSKKQEMEEYGAIAAQLFAEEHCKMELDAFNVLYVALTRAVKGLYIISKNEINSKGEPNMNRYSGLFVHYLKNLGIYNPEQLTYGFGVLENTKASAEEEVVHNIAYQYSSKDRPSFKILTRSGMLWESSREEALEKGNLIHLLLGYVETYKDVDKAIAILVRDGDLSLPDSAEVKEKLMKVIAHPKLAKYYQEGNIVKNEKDIITKDGLLLRPDRVVIQNRQATIIDYKTGTEYKKYHQQVNTYAYALEAMNYTIADKVIVYINEEITPEFIP